MEKKTTDKSGSRSTITVALISAIATVITACLSGIINIIASLPDVQKLSIPSGILSFIAIVLSIIIVSAVLITAITSYIRNQTCQANMAITKLVEKEKDLLQVIENETISLMAEKV